jgi:hypothetical protein
MFVLRTVRSLASFGLLSFGLHALLPQALAAQEAEWRTVNGRVVRPAPFLEGDTTAVVGMPNLKVVLHRVSSTLQGPLDSSRTDAEGRYRFRFQPSGGADAVYFVSAMHDDIAYFTNPLRGLVNEGSDAEIAVFDTTSVPFPLTVRGRHLIVGALDSLGERTVVEIFEVSNDSTRTLVAPDSPDADPTWSFPIPRAARDVKAGQGDVSADAFVQSPGRVALYAALAPGLKQLSVTYKVPDNGFPLDLVIDGGAVVLEVLLEEPDATVRGANLVAVEPVGLEGRQFVRYLAQDVRPGAAITIDTPSGKLGGRGLYVTALLGAIGLLMLLALFRAGTRRQTRRETVAPRLGAVPYEVPTPERLAREIADLDAAFAAQTEPSEAVRAAYTRRRAELADLLREELAARTAGV